MRAHAVDLAKAAAMTSLQRLHDDLPSLDSAVFSQRRAQVLQQLKRIAPGRSTTLPAVLDQDGELQTAGSGMADALRRH